MKARLDDRSPELKRGTKVLAILVAILATAGAAQAGTTRWVPGTSYMVEEQDASDILEQTYDHAYCTGVPRFGHRGEFPYETFLVFDGSISHNGKYCSDQRYKSLKGKRRGWFQLKLIRRGNCF